jgi:hypothetical protein
MRLTYPNDMVRALRTNEVSTLEVILYSGLYISNIVFLVLSYFSRFPLLYVPFQTQEIQLIDAVLTFILVIVELVGAYYLNDQGDGVSFWKRFVSLQIALVVPVLILAGIVSLVESFRAGFSGVEVPMTLGSMLFGQGISLIFTVWLLWLIYRVSRPESTTPPPVPTP